jgi:superfamily II DNA or RNA helicase
MELRDYQREIIECVVRDWKTYDRVLVHAATGAGKTIVFLALLDQVCQPGKRALILAHRRELIYQPIEKAQKFFPELAERMGIVMAENDYCEADIVVATVQSLNSGNRLERVGKFDYIIIDETHRATATTYRNVLDSLPGAKVLGVTATPKRTDKVAMGEIFQKTSYRFGIAEAVERGALVNFSGLGFTLDVDASHVKEVGDGWDDEAMGEILSAKNVLDIVHSKWFEYANGRQTIAFTESVKQAEDSEKYFNDKGIKSASISGKTPSSKRDAVLCSYKRGEINIIFNCMVLTEGFDAPETNCIMMISPTRSDLVYIQRMGRGLRIFPGKTDCLILDFKPMGARDMLMAGDMLEGIREQKAIKSAISSGVELIDFSITQNEGIKKINPDDVKTIVLELMSKSSLAWSYDGEFSTATLDVGKTMVIVGPDEKRLRKAQVVAENEWWSGSIRRLRSYIMDKFHLWLVERVDDGINISTECISYGIYDSFKEARNKANELGINTTLASKSKKWREEPASSKQMELLNKLNAWQDGMTKGQAAQRITHVFAKKAVRKKECECERRIYAGLNDPYENIL